MSCDMPGPWDAECAVLYVNMQWQSLAIVGNRVAVVWQSSGNRTIPEMRTQLSRGIRNHPRSGGCRVPKDVAGTKARDLQHLVPAWMSALWQARLCELQCSESDHHGFVPHLHEPCLRSPYSQIVICSENHLSSSSMCSPPCFKDALAPLFEIHDRT